MPGASSMRGITGYRLSDVMNGALAQLIPDRVPAAGEGGSTLAFFTGTVERRAVRLQRARRRHLGRPPGRRRERRAREPVRQHGEHPGRARRERLADPDRALRPRHRLGRRRPVPRRPRGRARLARARARTRPCTSAPTGRCTGPTASRAGCEGGASSSLLFRAGGTLERMPPMFVERARSPATSSTTGCPAAAAGATRSSASPRRSPSDVLDEKISVAAARELYGVVVDPRRRGRRRGDGRLRRAKVPT